MKSVLFLLLFVNQCLSANILIINGLSSPSNYIWHKGYALTLAKRGHNVTILTHDDDKEKTTNYTVITLEGIYSKIYEHFKLESSVQKHPMDSINFLIEYDMFLCEHDPTTKGFKALLNYPDDFKFDLIIINVHTSRCLFPIIDKFKSPPIIATAPIGNQPYVTALTGNYLFSTIPFMNFHTTDKMSFIDRLENFFYLHYMNFRWRYMMISKVQAMATQYFGPNIKQIHEYERQISLVLVNSDPIVNYPHSIYPNIIPVAGIHIPPPKQLPKDIKEILDNAKHGVVFVSFGSNLDLNKMELATKQAFIAAFKMLPQTVLMKSKMTEEKLPENVIARPWLPQNDILAHPNVKLFITHGGALGTQEGMYHGVPIIGMPFYIDQHGNVAKIEIRKLGKMIKHSEVTFDYVYGVIKEVLENPVYRENIQLLSKRFKDQPQTPMERAIFWTEYVLRHGGAEHLNPPTRDMNIFERLDFDIYAVILSLLAIACLIAYFLITRIINIWCYLRNKLKKKQKSL